MNDKIVYYASIVIETVCFNSLYINPFHISSIFRKLDRLILFFILRRYYKRAITLNVDLTQRRRSITRMRPAVMQLRIGDL